MPRHLPPPYLDPHQSRTHEVTPEEQALAAAIERAFSDGVEELDDLVESVNEQGLRDPDGAAWTVDTFRALMARLGA